MCHSCYYYALLTTFVWFHVLMSCYAFFKAFVPIPNPPTLTFLHNSVDLQQISKAEPHFSAMLSAGQQTTPHPSNYAHMGVII